jgi:hypothetical protein
LRLCRAVYTRVKDAARGMLVPIVYFLRKMTGTGITR